MASSSVTESMAIRLPDPQALLDGDSVSVGDGDSAPGPLLDQQQRLQSSSLSAARNPIAKVAALSAPTGFAEGQAVLHQTTAARTSTDASAEAPASAKAAAPSASATAPSPATRKAKTSADATATKAAPIAVSKHKALPSGSALAPLSVDGETYDTKAEELSSGNTSHSLADIIPQSCCDDEHECFLKALLIMRACWKGVQPFVAAVMDALHKKVIDDVRKKVTIQFPSMSEDAQKSEWDCSMCIEAKDNPKFVEDGTLCLRVSACADLNGVVMNGVVKTESPHGLKLDVLHHGSRIDDTFASQQLLMYARPDPSAPEKSTHIVLLNAQSPMGTKPHLTPFQVKLCSPHDSTEPHHLYEPRQFYAVLCSSKPGITDMKVYEAANPTATPFGACFDDSTFAFAFWSLRVIKENDILVTEKKKHFKYLEAPHGLKNGDIVSFHGGCLPSTIAKDLHYLVVNATGKKSNFCVCGPIIDSPLPPSFEIVRQSPICRFRDEALQYKRAKESKISQGNVDTKKQKTKIDWSGINAHELSSKHGEFCKIFCSKTSRNLTFFVSDDIESGEQFFNMIEYCKAFHSETFKLLFKIASTPKHDPTTNPQASLNDALTDLRENAIFLREIRNKYIGHGNLHTLPKETFVCMLQNARKFLDAVKHIAIFSQIRFDDQRAEDCICEVEKIAKNMSAQQKLEANIQMAALRGKLPRSNHSLVTQNGSFFHAFICHRFGDNDAVAAKAANQLSNLMHKRAMEMPLHDGFAWPEGFISPEISDSPERNGRKNDSTGLRLFLDHQSLKHLDALLKSIVFIPVFSLKSLKVTSTSSLSDIAKDDEVKTADLNAGVKSDEVAPVITEPHAAHAAAHKPVEGVQSRQSSDNFWLELILARELHEMAKLSLNHSNAAFESGHPCSLVCPVFDPIVVQMLIPELDANPLKKLNKKARSKLEQEGLSMTNELEFDLLSPQTIISYYCDNKNFQKTTVHMNSEANITTETACALLEGVRKVTLSFHEQNTVYNFPEAVELNQFISDAVMSRYAPILARHYIHSVLQLSTLDLAPICALNVAKEAAKASALTLEIESMMLMDVITKAKKSSLSRTISAKFDNYIDQEASFLTAAFSASALDIFFSKRAAIFAIFVSGVVVMMNLLSSVISSDENSLCGPENQIPDAPTFHSAGRFSSANFVFGTISSSIASIRFPKSAKFILAFCFVLQTLFDVIHGFLVYDALIYRHCPANTTRYISECCLSCCYSLDYNNIEQKLSMSSYHAYRLTQLTVYIVLWIILCLCCLMKQSYVLNVFLLGFPIAVKIHDIWFLFLDASNYKFNVGIINFWIVFILLKGFQRYGRHLSSTIANQEAENLNVKYGKALGASKISLPSFDGLNPNAPVFQHHSDLCSLYTQHEFINGPFQVKFSVCELHQIDKTYLMPCFSRMCFLDLDRVLSSQWTTN